MKDAPEAASLGIAAEEEARRRISRELHDDFCQRLAALTFELAAVRRKLPETDPRRAELDAVKGGLGELSEDLRRLSHDLHPAILERRGLAPALRDHCAEAARRHSLPVRCHLRGAEIPLPPHFALGLYRIAQEALSNAVRHSGARAIEVTLEATGGSLRLAVVDDGHGFDPSRGDSEGGLGLAVIAERAQLLDGHCRITSAPGAGTEVEVLVPLPSAETELRRLVRRHRRTVAAAALVILALGSGLVATAWQARRASQEARRADAAVHFLEDLFQAADPKHARSQPPGTREILRRGIARLDRELRGEPLLRARLLDTLGAIHTELGLYDEAGPLLRESLALRERLRGPDHPEVARTLLHLAALAHLSGQGDEVALFRRALALSEARFGTESAEVAEATHGLGTALASRGRLVEAETLFKRSLALHERLFGDRDPRLARILHNLGGIAYYRDRTAEAEQYLKRALALREATLPPDDPDLAGSLEALGLLRQQQGRLAEAAELLERQVRIAAQVYGPGHPTYARTLYNLGLVKKDQGDVAAARTLLERALAITGKTLAPGQPFHVMALAAVADLDFEEGRYAEAEPLYRQLL
ncbi:MAG TPA: tetratricopeptide repeat protein, partial [Thermoanaerobaculia bacterium]|nr:tetratricopeptide repeat protein [Thermoanaerobaculia bacterium]